MGKLISVLLLMIVLLLVLPELLRPSQAQPRKALYICGDLMPDFVLDAQGVRLGSHREALQYLATQPYVNETGVGQLHHALIQLRWRGVQFRVWTDGGERINSIRDVLDEIRRQFVASWHDEPTAKPTIVGIAYSNVYTEYWLDPNVHPARLAQYLVTLYTSPC